MFPTVPVSFFIYIEVGIAQLFRVPVIVNVSRHIARSSFYKKLSAYLIKMRLIVYTWPN